MIKNKTAMKKTMLVTTMMTLSLFLSTGQIWLKKECNLPRAGDKYEKQQVEYIQPGDSGQNAIWHFNDDNNISVIDLC